MSDAEDENPEVTFADYEDIFRDVVGKAQRNIVVMNEETAIIPEQEVVFSAYHVEDTEMETGEVMRVTLVVSVAGRRRELAKVKLDGKRVRP